MKSCIKHPDSERYVSGACRKCSLEASRRWQKANPEKMKANSAKWVAANPEKVKANNTVQHAKPERKAACAAWRAANPDKVKASWRRKAYKAAGMKPVLAETALALHNGCCDCCGSNEFKGKGWCVDHEHDTGRIRGILCSPCNLAIGQLGDTIEGVLKAVRYLERSKEKQA